jgi:hypothetical protein
MNIRRYILSLAGQPPTREQLAEASVLLVALRCFYQAYNGWPFWQYIASGFSCPIGVCPAQPFPLKHGFTAWTVVFDPSTYHNFARPSLGVSPVCLLRVSKSVMVAQSGECILRLSQRMPRPLTPISGPAHPGLLLKRLLLTSANQTGTNRAPLSSVLVYIATHILLPLGVLPFSL